MDDGVELEDEQEERPVVFEDLDEEVPEDADVRAQVRRAQAEMR